MQNFTGSIKKSIAGILCVLSIFFYSPVFANDSPVVAENSAVAASSISANPVAELSSVQSSALATLSGKSVAVPVKTNSASQLASLVGGLLLILVLIYGLSWFVKRFSQGGFLQNPTMKIVSAMPLGTRERLMLVDVGGKQLLLGVTATQINTLHVFDEPVVNTDKDQAVPSEFSQKLMSILQSKPIASSVSAINESSDKKSNS